MSSTLALTALLMGLAGGPHCAAMCGAACAGISRLGPRRETVSLARALWSFQAGRLVGYSLAGAAAALAVQSLAWLTTHMAALRPVWTLFHLAVLLWGLMLLAQARQPAWAASAGRLVWSRLRPLASARGGIFATGALWAFMPCGLLYSALLVASLSGGPLAGALSMALFAAGSSLSLMLVPWLYDKLQDRGNKFKQEWGTRAAGGLLVLAAAWALWADAFHRFAEWCGLA
jgi:sulfite exporter TauE/SafE